MRVMFSFCVQIALATACLAIGLLMVFWPSIYVQWIRWSRLEDYAPWLVRGLDDDPREYGLRFRRPGIAFALCGVVSIGLIVWIRWFQ
jgi:hypothetical protein